MPSDDDFPFSVRVTADTLSSSGSSSMAAVCAASLALKTAGVPIAALAAGISVGLVSAAPPQLGSAVPVIDGSNSQQQQQDAGFCINPGSYSSFVAAGWRSEQKQQGGSGSSSSSGSDSDSSSSSSSSSDEDAAAADSTSSKAVGRQVHESSCGQALLLTDIQGIEDHLGDMDFKVGCQGLG